MTRTVEIRDVNLIGEPPNMVPFRIAAGAVFLGMRGLPLKEGSTGPNSRGLLLGNIMSIGLGQRNKSTSVYPNMWAPIGGFIEEGESVKEGLIREISEELGISLGKVIKKNSSALMPIWVEVDWGRRVIYYVFGYFYYFHLKSEAEVNFIDNVPQIIPKHLHPEPLIGGGAHFRGLGDIRLDEEIQAFGNFGLYESWVALHSPTQIATTADILRHGSKLHFSGTHVAESNVKVEAFTPIAKTIIDGINAANDRHRKEYTMAITSLRVLLRNNALNYSLPVPREKHGLSLPKVPSQFNPSSAGRHLMKIYAKSRDPNRGEYGGIGFLRSGGQRVQKSVAGRGIFDMPPEMSEFEVPDIIEWARKNGYPHQWWTSGLPREQLLQGIIQRKQQTNLPTPFLDFNHHRRTPEGTIVGIPTELMKASTVAVMDELMRYEINQT